MNTNRKIIIVSPEEYSSLTMLKRRDILRRGLHSSFPILDRLTSSDSFLLVVRFCLNTACFPGERMIRAVHSYVQQNRISKMIL